MDPKRRERLLLILALSAAGLFVGDWLILGPALAWRERLAEERAELDDEVEAAERLIAQHPTRLRQWEQIRASNLMSSKEAAEGPVDNWGRKWAPNAYLQKAGEEKKGKLPQVLFRVSATGQMSDVAAFLQNLEKADFPVRVTWLHINSKKDGADDLSFDARLSTLYLPRDGAQTPRRSEPTATEEGNAL